MSEIFNSPECAPDYIHKRTHSECAQDHTQFSVNQRDLHTFCFHSQRQIRMQRRVIVTGISSNLFLKIICKHWHFTISNNNLLVTADRAHRYFSPDPLSLPPLPEVPPTGRLSIIYMVAIDFCVYFSPRGRGQVLAISLYKPVPKL